MFNKTLDNSGLRKNNKSKNYSNDKSTENIILRYIPNDKNILNYIDIRLDSFEYFVSLNKSNSMNSNTFNFIETLSSLNSNNITFDNDLFVYYNKFEGFSLEENFDKNIIELLSQIDLDGYKLNVINIKYYYDLDFKMNYFEYQNQIRHLLL